MAQKFPEIGLRAVFDISGYTKNYQRYQKSMADLDKITKQTAQNMTRSGQAMGGAVAGSLDDLIQQSQALQDLSAAGLLVGGSLDILRDAFNNLGQGMGVNVEQFDQLVLNGTRAEDAIGQAATTVEDAAGSTADLSQSLLILSSAYQAVVPALRAAIQLVQVSIEEYNDLAEQTRRLRYQTGLASEEASSWILSLQATGLSASTAQRALTSFLDKVAETSREQALGEESTSEFAEAIEILGVDLKDNEGNLKATSELLTDVDAAFKRMGPGAESASAAQALFGYSGRFLLPLLLSERVTLEDLAKTAERYGATLNALSQQEYEDFRKAQFELLVALQGVYNHIAKQWTPVLTQIQRILANVISIWRTFVGIMSGTEVAARGWAAELKNLADFLAVVNLLMQEGAKRAQVLRDILDPMGAVSRAVARAEEERAQAMAKAAQAASEARAIEEKRQEAIQETLLALDEIRAQYIGKLSDLEQDAARKWEDILINRQRDAIDRARQEAYRLIDLQAEYNRRLDDIEADFAKRWEDILVNRQREALIRGIQLAFRYEDLARNAARARQDAIRDAQEREAEQRRDFQRRVEDLERDSQRRREELEREHQRRIRDIRQQFVDTATEAARRNDAVAVARAQRERARALRDEQQRYDDEREDLRRALEERRNDIELDRRQREEDQRRELERALQRIEENYRQQIEELQRQNERERLIREIRYAWELEDLNAAKAEQQAAAQAWYDQQLEDFRLAKAREQLERDLAYKREEEDLNRAWQQRIDDLNAWYEEERNALAEHLTLTGQQLDAAYDEWARAAAEAATAAARAASEALAEEIIRYQHLLTDLERARAQAVVPGAAPPAGGPLPAPVQVGPWPPGAPVLSQAEGGVVQASSPTHIVMGDAGPETAVFMPGRASSLNVNHNFGRLGVDFEGLPGGVNTAQVQAIVYQVITQLAKGIQIPR